MDWDAEGLLDGLEGDAREERRGLLDELREQGVSVEDLRRAVAEERLVLLPVERALASAPKYTAREVAERSGLELDFLVRSWRALGLPVPGVDEPVFGDDDVEAARLGLMHRRAGFDDEAALEVTRVLGRGMAGYAEAARNLVGETLLEPGLSERELAHRYAKAAETLVPLAGPWLRHVFALHLRESLRRDAVTMEERRAGRLTGERDCTVAFADLVGFTKLGESVPLAGLAGVAGQLSELAEREVDGPVRIVKVIGDAVMLVSPEPASMVDTALRLVERAEADDELPALRAGVATGAAVNRYGDWFGTPVNLASRLTARARPDSVLVTADVRDAAGERFAFSDAGPKRLKGFSSPVHAFRARRA